MLMTLRKLFTDHPQSVDESYLEHLGQALYFATQLLLASFVCFIHALLPFAFEKTGSQRISHLQARMVISRNRKGARRSSKSSLSPSEEFAGSGI